MEISDFFEYGRENGLTIGQIYWEVYGGFEVGSRNYKRFLRKINEFALQHKFLTDNQIIVGDPTMEELERNLKHLQVEIPSIAEDDPRLLSTIGLEIEPCSYNEKSIRFILNSSERKKLKELRFDVRLSMIISFELGRHVAKLKHNELLTMENDHWWLTNHENNTDTCIFFCTLTDSEIATVRKLLLSLETDNAEMHWFEKDFGDYVIFRMAKGRSVFAIKFFKRNEKNGFIAKYGSGNIFIETLAHTDEWAEILTSDEGEV